MDHSEAKRMDRGSQDALLRRLRDDFTYYAPRVLRIKEKAGKTIPLKLNREQEYLHGKLEEQRAKTGRVRAIVVKPRQRGISTYIEARFYHQCSMRPGKSAVILTHEDKATRNLFDMVDRYYANDAVIHPHVDRSNANELRFDKMDSGYRVATAGGTPVRSFTFQLFHGSEAAHWKIPQQHMAAVGQTVPDAPGTEIILESTGNGRGTWFHQMVLDALAEKSDYLLVFFPWYWADDYRKAVPEGYHFTAEDREYQERYGLDEEQLYWRRSKIDTDFRGDESLFRQEYPAILDDAFIEVKGSYIPGELVERARKHKVDDPVGPLVVGADPISYGDDRFAVVWRRGRKMLRFETHLGYGTMQCAGRIAQIIQQDKPAKVFVDMVGVGAGVVDRLHEMGYGGIVVGVMGSEKPVEPEIYYNSKAEHWARCKAWLDQEGGVEVVDADALQADLTTPRFHFDSTGQRLQIESKEQIKSRGLPSPDIADALVLTFAQPVSETLASAYQAPQRVQRRRRDWRVNL